MYQGTIGCTPNSVPMVFMMFSRDSWRLQPIITHKYPRAIGLISHRGTLGSGYIQLSNEKNPGCLGYLRDYTTQLYRGYNKPLYGSLLTNQYSGK